MFDRQLALEKQQDYRGPATRFVAPISDIAEANRVIRECCFAMLALGAFQIFLTLTMGGGSITIGVTLIAAAAFLLATRGVVGAAVLLAICIVLVSAQAWASFLGYPAVVWVALLRCVVAARALYAALRRRRLSRVSRGNQPLKTRRSPHSSTGSVSNAADPRRF
jgi:hypothetical protein